MSSRATVSLSAIRHNLGIARAQAPHCALLFAVKANAYGHGAVAVASSLERDRAVDWLGVAGVAEGQQLREAGIGLPILKLSGCLPDQWGAALDAELTLTVTDADSIRHAAAAAHDRGRPASVHLKVDTGMGRIGLPPQHTVDLVRLIDDSPDLELTGLFTHFASADAADDGGFTDQQNASFDQVVEAVHSVRGRVLWVHSANSAGVLFGDQRGRTMVRPGIMGYGYHPDANNPAPVDLRPALSWQTELAFVKHVPAGTPISYGSTWHAPRDTWIGTIPVGYGDGFGRTNSGGDDHPGGRVVVGSALRPVVGRVCMDQTMIDLGVDGDRFQPGEPVVLIGDQDGVTRSADDVAALASTISYETLCAISARVERLHVD